MHRRKSADKIRTLDRVFLRGLENLALAQGLCRDPNDGGLKGVVINLALIPTYQNKEKPDNREWTFLRSGESLKP